MTYKAQPPTKKSDQLGFRPKRFWQETGVGEAKGGYAILLGGRTVKTPQGATLIVPTRPLAEAVAAEWAAVGDHVNYEDMPLTRLGFAAIDRMDDLLEDTVTEVLRYAETDLLCYPSEYPAALQTREDAAWLPLLDWARSELGLDFFQNKSLIHKAQSQTALDKIQSLISKVSPYERAGLMAAIPVLGSVILALAVWRGHLSGEAAFAASRVGEDFQSETWGRDEEAAKRAEGMKASLQSVDAWFRALA